MVKIRMVRQWRNAEWDAGEKVLCLPLPVNRKAFLVTLHEIMHYLKGHKEAGIKAEIEVWRGIRKVFSFLHFWTVADEEFVDYCLASYLCVNLCDDWTGTTAKRFIHALVQQCHPAELCSIPNPDWTKFIEEVSASIDFYLSSGKLGKELKNADKY